MTRTSTSTGVLRTGGTLNPTRDFYLKRQVDPSGRTLEDQLKAMLLNFDDTCITGSRQVGKSSLANYVSHELRSKHHWKTAWIDLDSILGRNEHIVDSFIDALYQQSAKDNPPQENVTLTDALRLVAAGLDSPLLIVVDEVDSLIDKGVDGARMIREFRAAQNTLRAVEPTAKPVVFCFVSIRGISELFDPEKAFGRAEAPLSVDATTLPIGLFPATDDSRRQLEVLFRTHDPASAGNLARWVLEKSGGYPRLCTELISRLILTHTKYAEFDLEDFLETTARWYKTKASADERRFLDVSASIVTSDPPSQAIPALDLYRRVRELMDTHEPLQYVPWDPRPAGAERLKLAGLIRIGDDGRIRTLGDFMDRYFDVVWARQAKSELMDKLGLALDEGNDAILFSEGRPKVCVIVTGGTMGMIESGNRVVPPETPEDLEREYAEVNRRYDVKWIPLLPLVDSADVGPAAWHDYSEMIHRQLREDYSGVVVVHGTDTLAFSASAVAFALGSDLRKPVVFTGSQTTVNQVHGDARPNLLRACMVACEQDLPEVVIMFGDQILRGVRAVKRDDRRFDAFESLLYPPLGVVSETVQLQKEIIRPKTGRPDSDVKPTFVDGIVVISQVPGSDASFWEHALTIEDPPPRGVILQTLGAGNIPTKSPYDLTRVIKVATERGIPILLASQYPIHPDNMGRYLPSRRAIEAGAIPIRNMTIAATVAKLSWVLGDLGDTAKEDGFVRRVADRMLFNYIGEL